MKSWRDVLPIHPAAELFPLMSPAEQRELGQDIKQNGLTSPIVLWQGERKSSPCLLDGRNRLDAIETATGSPAIIGAPSLMAGKDFLACDRVIVLDHSVDPFAYVISANIHRRHLTAEQKRELIAGLIKAAPEKSDRQIAKTVKVDHKTVASVRAEKEGRGEIPHVAKRQDAKGRQQPARKSRPPPVPEEVLQQRADSAERIRALMGGNKVRHDIGPASNDETARKEGEGEGSELGNLLRAWDRASQGAREKFKARVGLVAVEPPAKAMDDGLDIPACLRRTAP